MRAVKIYCIRRCFTGTVFTTVTQRRRDNFEAGWFVSTNVASVSRLHLYRGVA